MGMSIDRPCLCMWVVVHGLSSDGSQSALLKINCKNSKTSKKSKISKNSKSSKIFEISKISNISKNSKISKNSEISKIPRLSGRDFPKHKGELFGIFGNLDFSKFWKSRKLGARILEISELILGGLIVTHPIDHALRLT